MRDQIDHDMNNDLGQTVIHVLDSLCPNEAELGTTNEAINPNPYQHADETNNDNTGMKDQDKYWGEITGEELDPNVVKKARKLELDYFKSKKVYHKVPRAKARAITGKNPITIRWIDVNKGDDKNPNYRSRLVAREMNYGKEESIFAATPPLEAKKALFSIVASRHGRNGKAMKISFVDISRAYFNAKCEQPTFIELPTEDSEEGMIGELDMCMYGTRRAAQGWEAEYISTMTKIGFECGKASPCCFYHRKWDLRCVVHGDDFACIGEEEDLNRYELALENHYELKIRGSLGPEDTDLKEI